MKVNDTVTIRSPIDPVPKGLHWLSQEMESEVPELKSSHLIGMAYSHFFEKFAKTHNRSWTETFDLDRRNRWLKIRNVQLNFTDVYRIYVDVSLGDYKDAQEFDVAINLMVYSKKYLDYSVLVRDLFLLLHSIIARHLGCMKSVLPTALYI